MSEQAASSSAGHPRKDHRKSRITNGSKLLLGVDGRSAWVKRCKDIIAAHVADLGGEDNSSAAERSLIRRVAVLTTELERLEVRFAQAGEASDADLDLYQRTAGNLRRLLEAVGIQRRARDVSSAGCRAISRAQGPAAHVWFDQGWGRRMRPRVSVREAFDDPHLLAHVLAGPSWLPWRVLLIAAMGEALTDDERPIFTRFTGRTREPLQRVTEFAAVVGRRGGKTTAMAAAATYISACCDHTDALSRGETGVLLCVAQDQRVAKKLLEFIEAYLADSEILRQLVKGRTADSIELANNISIEVRPASFRKLRGPTYIGVICDELAFWYVGDEFANPDDEILAAVRPGLLTTRGPLIMASSPYARKGVLWETYKRHYGPDGSPSVLVAKGATRDFNTNIPQSEIDSALERDRARNTAELLAEFRSDIESFVALEVVQAAVGSYFEIAPSPTMTYYAFTDPSGGSKDSFALALAHRDGDGIVVDCIRETRPPFCPSR